MEEKKRLDTKIHRLFHRAGHPRWLHHMGQKKFLAGNFWAKPPGEAKRIHGLIQK